MKRLVIFILFIFFFSFVSALECPLGLVNDSYPGSCGIYTDTNKDGICDYSQDLISQVQEKPQVIAEQETLLERYNLVEIIIITSILYFTSFLLLRKKRIVLHKKIWNILLLLSFLASAVTAIVFLFNPSPQVTFNHIETGLVMILISVFHTLEHIPYWKSYLKFK